jgi:dipeptidyl aminopeptidase/acylaminoacyl peptidase
MWSPDGRYLAYRRANCPDDYRAGVVISDPEGNVIAEFAGDGWDIGWSPDSTRVAVWVTLNETIGVYGLDGERQALLTLPPGWSPGGDHDPVWLPDGQSLLVPELVVPIDRSTPYRLPSADRGPTGGTYSPDESRVAYVANRSVVVAEADGSNPQVVFGDWAWNPVWSPTGDRIAFTTQGVSGRGLPNQLRVVDLSTGTVTLLAEADGSDMLQVIDFSLEGDRIYFSRMKGRPLGGGLALERQCRRLRPPSPHYWDRLGRLAIAQSDAVRAPAFSCPMTRTSATVSATVLRPMMGTLSVERIYATLKVGVQIESSLVHAKSLVTGPFILQPRT